MIFQFILAMMNIPVKAGLNMLGFDFGIPRLPLVGCSYELKKHIHELLL